jgi:hypothetical protein
MIPAPTNEAVSTVIEKVGITENEAGDVHGVSMGPSKRYHYRASDRNMILPTLFSSEVLALRYAVLLWHSSRLPFAVPAWTRNELERHGGVE